MDSQWAWALGQGVLGAVFGSYIATVALRWPAPARGRSACDGCGEALSPPELIPLVSFLALRGRCRRCGAAIALMHPVLEALGVTIGLGAGLIAPGSIGLFGAVFGWLLLVLGAIDFVALRLPNPLTGALAAIGLVQLMILDRPFGEHLAGAIAGFASLWIAGGLYQWLRGRQGLGGGDAKLLGGIGLWLGWRALPWVVLIACLIGLVIAVGRRMRRDGKLPFGTLLGVGAFAIWCVQTWGEVPWT
jgi:leader peptidase (prepilin peptidase) / N-methyltransferase